MFDMFFDSLAENNISFRSITVIGIGDVIDILIITYLTYKILIWIKETRAWALLKGFLVIMAFYASAHLFNLHTVQWLISNTLNVGLIAIIVLFQPELRRVLEQLGKGRFFAGFTASHAGKKLSAKTKEAIIRAAREMAKARTGALIVVEKEIGMAEYEHTGFRLDAEVSSQLLISIFENKTPLHDGAVIIKDNRIVAASCILPLTQHEIDKQLGTRHRAGVGASEVSDATIIIVSEETGEISIASGGKLDRNLSDAKIRHALDAGSDKGRKIDWKKPALWKGRQSDDL